MEANLPAPLRLCHGGVILPATIFRPFRLSRRPLLLLHHGIEVLFTPSLSEIFPRHRGGVVCPGVVGNAAAVEPFKTRRGSRISRSACAPILSVIFSPKKPVREKKIDIISRFIDYCAEQGCDGAELTSYYFPKQGFTDEWRANFPPLTCTFGALRSATLSRWAMISPGPEENIPEEIKKVKTWIDHAAFLGAPLSLRVFSGMSKNSDPEAATKRCIAALKECCEYSGKKGIMRLVWKHHHGIVATSDQIINIINTVDSPRLAINCDTANFQTEDPYVGSGQDCPYAINVHFKGGNPSQRS